MLSAEHMGSLSAPTINTFPAWMSLAARCCCKRSASCNFRDKRRAFPGHAEPRRATRVNPVQRVQMRPPEARPQRPEAVRILGG